MKGNPGDTIICIDAPWHEACPHTPCGIINFGPKKNDIVTIDFLMEDERGVIYFRIKEYPDNPDDANYFAGFRNDFFEPIISDNDLYKDLNLLADHEAGKH